MSGFYTSMVVCIPRIHIAQLSSEYLLRDLPTPRGTRLILSYTLELNMDLDETLEYLSKEFDIERSEYVREVGHSVAGLRD